MDFAAWLPALHAFFAQGFENVFIELPGWVIDPANRFYWLYLASFAAVGVWAYRRYYPEARANVWAFLFPREVYTHPSALLDYKLLLINRFLGPSGFLSRVLLGSGLITMVATGTQQALTATLGARAESAEWALWSSTLIVVLVTVLRDLGTYITHRLSHTVPMLWEFHKVHHSAEVLTPFTVYRKHPVYNVVGDLVQLFLVAPVQGLIAFLFVGEPAPLTILGANLVFSLFHVAGANLRHSHIWLPFGPVWSRILISPAQHQVHHSKAERHWNRNYGEVFALWDWLFGSLYIPGKAREVLEFGVAGHDRQEHLTVSDAYWVPFKNCARMISSVFRRRFAPQAHP